MASTPTRRPHRAPQSHRHRDRSVTMRGGRQHTDPNQPSRNDLRRQRAIDFGRMRNDGEFLSFKSLDTTVGIEAPSFSTNFAYQELDITFALRRSKAHTRNFICKIPFAQIKSLTRWDGARREVNLLLQLWYPPAVFRRSHSTQPTRNDMDSREERSGLERQVGIRTIAELPANGPRVSVDDIDFGRWLSYRLVVHDRNASDFADHLCSPLYKNNVAVSQRHIEVVSGVPLTGRWDWLRPSSSQGLNSSLETLRLDVSTTHLPFEVLYQLEVCMSLGILYEGSFTPEFVAKLAAIVPSTVQKATTACRLLESVASSKCYYAEPMDIFSHRVVAAPPQHQLPSYCTIIRSATVTPTTIYFHSPVVDTSNRILRRYKHLEDRFLRVRFRDELYRGRLWSQDDGCTDEVFSRVEHVMKNGIEVGQRKFEFLAFGNSQFREHGAYFFAPTYDVSSEDIRKDMGSFDTIKTVAKYAARLGQSFSTTRTTSNGVRIVHIPDIHHNGYCFTDGVGKISLFMAQMIAQDMKLPTSSQHCPSLYQFRLAGCKGVLAVDPQAKGVAVHIRPSQNKFASKHSGLEICRASQFSASFLSQQIILILSALGVADDVFVARLRSMLYDLDEATKNELSALKLLQQSIDLNQTTVSLTNMVNDGFMASKEPFFISCLRLWRAWSIKYLKEKAKIFIEDGAFLFGCVDETNSLRGHLNVDDSQLAAKNLADLPEVFVQISQYDPRSPGKKTGYKVITGVCVVARNPALHPGDVRVVMAVEKPGLHHLRDVVVFPQNGDRDIASMCSGGDLDGDDYLVIWDRDLIPAEWNFPPMDYSPPEAVINDGPITVDSVVSFFVQHMKHNNLGRIATAHRFWADQLEKGVKDDKCLQLAALHSQAVDYAKTGVPAPLPKQLRAALRPHWAYTKYTSGKKVYTSRKILGQLYDEVDKEDFVPAWDQPFDTRILEAYEIDEEMSQQAIQLKSEYDAEIRKVMLQFEITTEFEVWTSFVMQHSDAVNDYKCAETLGETVSTIKQRYQKLVLDRAGTTDRDRDVSKFAPFLAAMYVTTAQEVSDYTENTEECHIVPLISFPWLFPGELGLIANGRSTSRLSSTTIVNGGLNSSVNAARLGGTCEAMQVPELAPLEEFELDDHWTTENLLLEDHSLVMPKMPGSFTA